MANTIASEKADIKTLLNGVTGLTSFDHEPASGNRGVWSSVSTAEITADFFRIAVRVYSDTLAGAELAQDNLDSMVPLVQAALLAGGYGPVAFQFDYDVDGQVVAICVLDVGREDYF